MVLNLIQVFQCCVNDTVFSSVYAFGFFVNAQTAGFIGSPILTSFVSMPVLIWYNLESGMVIPRAVLFLSRIGLTISGLLCIHKQFKLFFFFNSAKNVAEIVTEITLTVKVALVV